jgi:ABC-type lipoprotein release transport system permease subunit
MSVSLADLALVVAAPFIGSFMGLAVLRRGTGAPVVRGRSRCPACGRTLGPAELVPLAGAESFMINAYPISIQIVDLLVISFVAVALCTAAALSPAARAAAIEPAAAVNVEG